MERNLLEEKYRVLARKLLDEDLGIAVVSECFQDHKGRFELATNTCGTPKFWQT